MSKFHFDVVSTDPFYLKDQLKRHIPERELIDLSRGEPINTPDIISDSVFKFFWDLSLESNRLIGDKNLKTASSSIVQEKYKKLVEKEDYSDIVENIKDNVKKLIEISELDKADILKTIISEVRGEDYLSPKGSYMVRSIIADKFSNFFYKDSIFSSEEIVILLGGSEGIGTIFELLSFSEFLKDGDSVALNIPVYSPYKYIIEEGGYKVYSIMGKEDNLFAPSKKELDKFEEDARTGKIKLLILVNPGNPTGINLPPAVLRRMGKIAEENDIIVIEDFVYAEFLDEGDFNSLYEYAQQNTLPIGSSSKVYQSPGTRFGFIVIPDDFNNYFTKLLKKDYGLNKYRKDENDEVNFRIAFERAKGPDPWGTFFLTHHTPAPVQWITAFRYLNGKIDAVRFTNELKERWNTLYETLNIKKPKSKECSIVPYYALIDLSKVVKKHNHNLYNKIKSGKVKPYTIIEDIFLKTGVAIVPAAPFFLDMAEDYQWFVRFSVANQKNKEVREAAKRIVNYIKEYS